MHKIEDKLHDIILQNNLAIDDWFAQRYKKTSAFFYSSVDLRHSGYKIAPVDTNLFPAGFNLLSKNALKKAIIQTKNYFLDNFPSAKKILLIPENHTRNLFYLENIFAIKSFLEQAGLEVHIGALFLEEEQIELKSASGKTLIYQRITSKNNIVSTINGFVPDVIIVNNDLTSGAPEILKNIIQPVIPPVGMGWYRRRKTGHFDSYQEIVRSFAKKFDFDPWLISAIFHKCGTINFKQRKGLECVALAVEKTLRKVQKKYDEYGIKDEPYVFIKADSGTYGMGIITTRSSEELFEMNKKTRNKMNIVKEGAINSEVIIQEGVPTIDKIDGKIAEPMIYLVNAKSIGCTYRVNESRDEYSNLNAKGMSFVNACEEDGESSDGELKADILCPVQSLVAKLATLAASQECYEPQWEI